MPIQSLLDNDLYKFTMMNAVLHSFPDAEVEYRFIDRLPLGRYNAAFLDGFTEQMTELASMRVQDEEIAYIRDRLAFMNRPDFLSYLHEYRFDPDELDYRLDDEGNFHLTVRGNWGRAILWEVPVLAAISEQFFLHCDTDWNMDGQTAASDQKSTELSEAGCIYADFGTRRRRNNLTQEIFIQQARGKRGFAGTSNVHFARLFDLVAVGTMAHEWIMGISGLEGLRRANRDALWRWADTYDGNLGIALTDTFGTDAFFEDFGSKLARLFDGVRHDSGDPFDFGERVIAHYESMGIKPMTRTIVFSDSLDVETAIKLNEHFSNRINVSFGIGTHFTNDFARSESLQVVMKMWSVDGVPVIKLGDDPGKIHGDPDARRVARWIFHRDPLDSSG
jgi:nicotinate phosphoribosyltransferase